MSKALQTLSLICLLVLTGACGSKKQEKQDPETTDTTTMVTTQSEVQPIDTVTPVPPVNEVKEKVEPVIEKPTVKADVSGKGTIVQKGDIWVIRTSGPDGTDYLPNNLSDAFKVDGKLVTFEANMTPQPKGVRMAGRPITLISIK